MIEALLQLLAPVHCVFCSKAKTLFCLSHQPPRLAMAENLPNMQGYFASELDPAMLAALAAFKDRSMTALAPVFAKMIEPLIDAEPWQSADVVAVPPSSSKAYRSRGFVPVIQILRHSKNSKPILRLQLTRKIQDQRLLDARSRQENLLNAFRAKGVAGKKVVLFDDVLTTSSTLQEMRRAIELAGGQVTGFCVLARRFVDSNMELEIKA
jgi:predicted amidophosphoribosyltransferase